MTVERHRTKGDRETTTTTAADAIRESIAETRIVTVRLDAEQEAELSAASEDSVEADDVTEYWGTDDAGAEWRVHVERRAATETTAPDRSDWTTGHNESNARLIAAAPELLAAAQHAARAIRAWAFWDRGETGKAVQALEAAIAKAEGR